MTDPTPAVAPLDAYPTAKPDEPTFTLQAGDPLASPLVKLWAALARVRTGVISGDADWIYPSLEAACHIDSDVSGNAAESKNLQLRATAAEEVAWAMDAYRAGHIGAERAETPLENPLDEKARLDIYDYRRRADSCISNFLGELNEYRNQLARLGFIVEGDDELANMIEGSILALKSIQARIEIRRDFRTS